MSKCGLTILYKVSCDGLTPEKLFKGKKVSKSNRTKAVGHILKKSIEVKEAK